MGHRANFVVIRDGSATAYYDQWGALGCVFLLADGPAAAVRAVEHMERTEELMDWAFAEGGYLLDFDQRKVIAFGYPEDVGFDDFEGEVDAEELADISAMNVAIQQGPREFLQFIAQRWPGWLLQWDDRGVDAFSAHLRSREILGIRSQPDSHPDGREVFEVQA